VTLTDPQLRNLRGQCPVDRCVHRPLGSCDRGAGLGRRL